MIFVVIVALMHLIALLVIVFWVTVLTASSGVKGIYLKKTMANINIHASTSAGIQDAPKTMTQAQAREMCLSLLKFEHENWLEVCKFKAFEAAIDARLYEDISNSWRYLDSFSFYIDSVISRFDNYLSDENVINIRNIAKEYCYLSKHEINKLNPSKMEKLVAENFQSIKELQNFYTENDALGLGSSEPAAEVFLRSLIRSLVDQSNAARSSIREIRT